MKRLLSILLIPLTWSAFAQTKVTSEIEHVTVYKAGATVERKTQIEFKQGQHSYLLTGVPEHLDPNTIQVEVPSEVQTLRINYRYMTPEELGFDDLTEIGSRIAEVERQIEVQNDLMASLREDLDFIAVNSDVPSENSAATVRNVDAYLANRRRAIRSDIRSTLTRISDLQKTSQELRSEMASLEVELGKPKSVIELEASTGRTIRGNIEIKYFVANAQWIPFYNIRSGGVGTPLEFEFMASVRQNTGEDWDDVSLTLSTNDPAAYTDEPEIHTWNIGYREMYVPAVQQRQVYTRIPRTGSFYALIKDEESGNPLANARVELNQNGSRFIATSDEKGEVSINRLNEGAYSLTCYYQGYNQLSTSVSITPQPVLNRIALNKSGASRMLAVTLATYQSQTESITYEMPLIDADSDAEVVFIDGVKVRGSSSLPPSEDWEIEFEFTVGYPESQPGVNLPK